MTAIRHNTLAGWFRLAGSHIHKRQEERTAHTYRRRGRLCICVRIHIVYIHFYSRSPPAEFSSTSYIHIHTGSDVFARLLWLMYNYGVYMVIDIRFANFYFISTPISFRPIRARFIITN